MVHRRFSHSRPDLASGNSLFIPLCRLLIITAFLVGIVALVKPVAFLVADTAWYTKRLLPETFLGSQNVQGLTEKAMREVADQVDQQAPDEADIQDATSGNSLRVALADLGVHLDAEVAAQMAWQDHQKMSWWQRARQIKCSSMCSHQYLPALSINDDQIPRTVSQVILPKLSHSNSAMAKIRVTEQGIQVLPEEPGYTFDKETVGRRIQEVLAQYRGAGAISIVLSSQVVSPPVSQGAVETVAHTLDRLYNLNLTITAGSTTCTLSGDEISTWFGLVQDGKSAPSIVVRRDPIISYLSTHVAAVDASATELRIVSKLLEAMSTMATEVSVEAVMASIPEPVASPSAAVTGGGTATLGHRAGKYIEVSLAHQQMYLIEGNQLLRTFTVSTGAENSPTPAGEYILQGHIDRALSGLFHEWLPYWINFLDNMYGIHGLPEKSDGTVVGKDQLGAPASNGCIRLADADAKFVFQWAVDGTPIWIH